MADATVSVAITGDASGLLAAIGQAEKALSGLQDGKSSTGNKSKQKAEDAEKAAKKTQKAWKDAGEAIDQVTKPLQIISAATAAAGVASAKFAIDFENNFASVKKTVEGTPEQLKKIKKDIIDMTTVGINGHNAIPQTTAQLTELAAAGGQLGIATENISDFTETMAMIGSATNLQGEAGAATLARFMNVANVSQDKISNLGSAIVDLGNNFATTEAEIADMAQSMGSTATLVGISAQDTLAYATAMSSMGIEAQAGGSSLQRIWLDIQSAVSEGGDGLKSFAKISGKTSEEFSKQWKENASGAFKDFLKGLGGKSTAEQVGFLSELGFNNVRDQKAILNLSGEKGIEILTNALERSKTAWKENTALQDEFNKRAETTASKIAVTKNNIIEAARSMGEVMLPTIVDVTSDLKGFAQGLSQMSDSQKKAVVTGAAAVVGMGALAKGTASTIKTIGNLKDGLDKLGVAVPAISKIGPAITAGITSPAGVAAAAITGISIAGVAAYKSWYKSQYRWSEGLSEGNKQVQESIDKYKQLSNIQTQAKDLKLIIENPESSKEQVETAKQKLEEIKNILKEQYKINVDSEDLDAALEKAENLAKTESLNSETDLKEKIEDLAPKYEKTINKLSKLKEKYSKASEAAQKYRDAQGDIAQIRQSFAYNEIDEEEYLNRVSDAMKKAGINFDKTLGELPDKASAAAVATNLLGSKIEDLGIDGLDQKITDCEKSIEDYTQAVEGLANINLDNFTDALKAGADGTKYLERIAEYTKAGVLDADEYAKKVSLIKSEQQSLEEVFKSGGDVLDSYISDYIGNMTLFGASAEQTRSGLQSLADTFTELGHKLGTLAKDQRIEITADGKIIYVADYSNLEDAPEQEGSVKYGADFSGVPKEGPSLTGTITYKPVISDNGALKQQSVFSLYKKATGSQYFPGGLAMVNDQKGIADPRELIIDRGKAFIPHGKDVILPLSRGAKVYTAKQTKSIMSGLGIPHYSRGKNNSDDFVSASDDWTHYINTHAVTVTQELEKWVELSKKFKSNTEDIADIEEKIYSLTRKQNDELNSASKKYIDVMSEFNLWEETGDDPLAAYQRVWDRNFAEVQAQRMTQDEFDETVSGFGSAMYQNRIKQSKDWLEHEKKYHGLSNDDYIAGIKRMEAYTQEYYDRGIIGYAEYRREMSELDDMYLDNYINSLDRYLDGYEDYISKQKQYYGINATEALLMYDEMWAGAKEYLSHLEMSAEKRAEIENKLYYGRMDAQRALYTEYQKGADNYYKIRETFADWDEVGDSKTRYWTGYLANIEKMYREHNIGWQEYMDESMDKYLELYKAFEGEYDDKLKKYKDEMSEVSTEYADLRKSLQDEWSQSDRTENLDEINKLIGYYENAATEAGQQKYKDLLEQKKQLERDQQLADLETEESEKIAALKGTYDSVEKEKNRTLAELRKDSFNIFAKVEDMNVDTSNIKKLAALTAGTIVEEAGTLSSSLDSFTNAINKLVDKVGGSRVSHNTYNNNGTYNITNNEPLRDLIKQMTGTVVSGLGDVMIN